MPRISLYRPNKSNDYRFIDRVIKEQIFASGTDLLIHKYLGPQTKTESDDATQPVYDKQDPRNIQDLLFLENRNRKYDKDVYVLRGHYQIQNNDVDLTQFAFYLSSDTIYINVHYNHMIGLIGRKLMIGDVIELPHLIDYHPLNDDVPTALKRFYQVTDTQFASEGYSSTWFPHIWRIKCEPLIDSQEFADILNLPTNTDDYLGDWDKTLTYSEGDVVTHNGINYVATADTQLADEPGITTNWKVSNDFNLRDILSTYKQNLQINDAVIAEAANNSARSGFDRSQLYLVPTDAGVPTPPYEVIYRSGSPIPYRGQLIIAPGVPASIVAPALNLQSGSQYQLSIGTVEPDKTSSGSGLVNRQLVLVATQINMDMSLDYGTVDSMTIEADSDPFAENFMGSQSNVSDYLADNIPFVQFQDNGSPHSFGYATGYNSGDGQAPNGIHSGSGFAFPTTPAKGEYFLRTDYKPQKLFRFDGEVWRQISENVRTGFGFAEDSQSQRASFVNNSNVTVTSSGTVIPEKQSLSKIFKVRPD